MTVLVLGATGFVGRWTVRLLRRMRPDACVVEVSRSLGVDLRDRDLTFDAFDSARPDYVINCAANVGGIHYGYLHPAEIFDDNMRMVLNVFEACKAFRVRRLVQPISNCAYPAGESLFREEAFWSGPLHESVLVYGMTRKMMWVGAWAYRGQHGLDTMSLVLSNMYGPGDHFDEVRSHALGALVRKMVDASQEDERAVVVWGSGAPVREWLYVRDGAEALVRALDAEPYPDILNVGVGQGITIKELSLLIKDATGWTGELVFDPSRPDGAPYKTVDGSRGEKLLGWRPRTGLREGIEKTVTYYERHREALAGN